MLLLLATLCLQAQSRSTTNLITVRVGKIILEAVPDSATFYPILKKAWVNSLIAHQREFHYKLLAENDSTADNVIELTYQLKNLGYRDQQTALHTTLKSTHAPLTGNEIIDLYAADEASIGHDVLSHNFEKIMNDNYFKNSISGHFFLAKIEKQSCENTKHKLFLKPIETSEMLKKNQLEKLHQILLEELVSCAQTLDLPFCFVDSKDADKAIKINYTMVLEQGNYRFSIFTQEESPLGFVEKDGLIDSVLVEKELYRPFIKQALGTMAIKFLHKAVPTQPEED
jgi:hypothetical protein